MSSKLLRKHQLCSVEPEYMQNLLLNFVNCSPNRNIRATTRPKRAINIYREYNRVLPRKMQCEFRATNLKECYTMLAQIAAIVKLNEEWRS